jgi:Mce-associated membrane protein
MNLARRVAARFPTEPLRMAIVLTAVLAVLASLTAGWFGVSWYRAAHDESLELAVARDEVLRDAQQVAVNLNTLDHQQIEAGLDRWTASSTGQLEKEFRENRTSYAEAIKSARTKTEARVLDAAVAELNADAGIARVLLIVDVTATREKGEPVVNRQRLQLEMTHTEDGWKASAIQPVGSGA